MKLTSQNIGNLGHVTRGSLTKTWNRHLLNVWWQGWSFYQLQQFVEYKAAAFGIAVEYVSPAYTSQTCHLCLNLGSRKRERFNCLICGDEHADVNASHSPPWAGPPVTRPELATIRTAKSFRL